MSCGTLDKVEISYLEKNERKVWGKEDSETVVGQ